MHFLWEKSRISFKQTLFLCTALMTINLQAAERLLLEMISRSNAIHCVVPRAQAVQPEPATDLTQHSALWPRTPRTQQMFDHALLLSQTCGGCVATELRCVSEQVYRAPRTQIPPDTTNSPRSILTEIDELLHGQRWRRKFREMLDVFGHTRQGGVFHDEPHELHCCCAASGVWPQRPTPGSSSDCPGLRSSVRTHTGGGEDTMKSSCSGQWEAGIFIYLPHRPIGLSGGRGQCVCSLLQRDSFSSLVVWLGDKLISHRTINLLNEQIW